MEKNDESANASGVFDTIGKHWRAACRVVFRQDIGEIGPYAPWLTSYNLPITHRKSSISGKSASYIMSEYADGGKWADFAEMDFGKKYHALSINEIKDLDSLVEAVRGRAYYAGSLVLGNSKFVERSSRIIDSFYMYETGHLGDCKYIGYCTLGRFCEDCFGCNGIGESQFCIRCYETNNDKRCFETWMSQYSSDCYYSFGLNNCSDCMFSFHLRNKHFCIGNLELPKEQYAKIQEKLLLEMAEKLQKEKRLPSLPEIAGKAALAPVLCMPSAPGARQAPGKKFIEDAFEKTCALVLGKKLSGGIDDYADWLKKHTRGLERCKSAASGRSVMLGDYASCFELPRNRLLTIEEGQALGEKAKIAPAEAESMSLANAHGKIGNVAYFSPEYRAGQTPDCIECPTAHDSSNCYRAFPTVYSKFCAYSFWPRSSQYAFGCATALDFEFCINCYNSSKLRRCFECDSCRDCSDLLFCHNCENVRDSLFCFNVKNKQYAIGNAEVGKEEFSRIKKLLLSSIVPAIERNKTLGIDIYNIGANKHGFGI